MLEHENSKKDPPRPTLAHSTQLERSSKDEPVCLQLGAAVGSVSAAAATTQRGPAAPPPPPPRPAGRTSPPPPTITPIPVSNVSSAHVFDSIPTAVPVTPANNAAAGLLPGTSMRKPVLSAGASF